MNELTIQLNAGAKVPLYEQIYQYMKTDIRKGRISCGEKLPSTRALSRYLEVSRSTVELAYEQLLSEGYIESVPCRGYFAAHLEGIYQQPAKRCAVETEKTPKDSWKYDFSLNGVDLSSFPYDLWRKCYGEVLRDGQAELFRAGDSQGELGFRSAICNYLYEARGVEASPDQVVVGAGSEAVLMLLGIILGPEHTIAFEDPAYKQAYRLMQGLSYETVPVPLDRSGMEVAALERTKADTAYVTPSHQYPTGIVMPVGRRLELLRWADGSPGRYIIEDDYDSEFRYKGKPIPALKGFDQNEKVIYISTFSKSIAPGLRLGYMVLPRPLLERYQARFRFINSTVSKADQRIVQRFLEEGRYERHLNKMRSLYKSRHDALIGALKPLSGICRICGENAGVHLLLRFPADVTEEELIGRAKAQGIRVYGLSDYRIRKDDRWGSSLLLGYANLTERQICEAGRILVECWGDLAPSVVS